MLRVWHRGHQSHVIDADPRDRISWTLKKKAGRLVAPLFLFVRLKAIIVYFEMGQDNRKFNLIISQEQDSLCPFRPCGQIGIPFATGI